jgi:hypothetical protein
MIRIYASIYEPKLFKNLYALKIKMEEFVSSVKDPNRYKEEGEVDALRYHAFPSKRIMCECPIALCSPLMVI